MINNCGHLVRCSKEYDDSYNDEINNFENSIYVREYDNDITMERSKSYTALFILLMMTCW